MIKYEKNTYLEQNQHLIFTKIFFTIITPVFNGEKYLSQYFKSLINQTFTNFEIILINDGSQDKTLDIINSYKNKFSYITILEQNKKGQGVARNKALKIAKGEYILFIDSDDLLASKNSLKDLFKEITKSPTDLILFGYQKIYNNKIFKPNKKLKELLKNKTITTIAEKKILLTSKKIGGPWNKVYSKTFLQKNNIKFAENLKFEDAYFFWQVIVYAKHINFINKIIYNYRKHNLATMRNYNYKNLDIIVIYQLIINFLKKENLFQEFYYILLNRALPSFLAQFKKTPFKYKKEFFLNILNFKLKYILEHYKKNNGKLNNKSYKIIKALNTNNFILFYLKSYLL